MPTTKQYQLPRAFAEKWVAALRSGEYKQGKMFLMDSYGNFCCIGVAGKVCDVPDKILAGRGLIVCEDAVETDLPIEFNDIPKILKGKSYDGTLIRELTDRNDRGVSFSKIADWIEQNVEFI